MQDHIIRRLASTMVIDIETVADPIDYSDVSNEVRGMYENRYRNNEYPPEYHWPKAALTSEFNRIISLSALIPTGLDYDDDSKAAVLKAKVMNITSITDETKILESFNGMLRSQTAKYIERLGGHNIKGFDVPTLIRKYIMNGYYQGFIPSILTNVSSAKPWEMESVALDLMHLWQFGNITYKSSLGMICHALGVKNPKENVSGKDMPELIRDGRIQEIADYCNGDVISTTCCIAKLLSGYDVVVEPEFKQKTYE